MFNLRAAQLCQKGVSGICCTQSLVLLFLCISDVFIELLLLLKTFSYLRMLVIRNNFFVNTIVTTSGEN